MPSSGRVSPVPWSVRGASAEKVYGGGDADGLPARGQLGSRLRRLVEAGTIELHTAFGIAALKTLDTHVSVEAVDGRTRPWRHQWSWAR